MDPEMFEGEVFAYALNRRGVVPMQSAVTIVTPCAQLTAALLRAQFAVEMLAVPTVRPPHPSGMAFHPCNSVYVRRSALEVVAC